MKYNKTPNKIQKSWTIANKNEIKINQLKKYKNSPNAINHFKNYFKGETDWILTESLDYTIQLFKFPEKLLPYIKVIPLIKTEEVNESGEDYLEDFTCSYRITRLNEEEQDLNNYEVVASLSIEQPESQYLAIYLKIMIIIVNEQSFKELNTYTWVRG